MCVFLLAVFMMIGNAAATSANTDLSDIWWNPAEIHTPPAPEPTADDPDSIDNFAAEQPISDEVA